MFSGYSQMIIFSGKRSAIVMMPGPLPFPHHYLCGLLLLTSPLPTHPQPYLTWPSTSTYNQRKYLFLSSVLLYILPLRCHFLQLSFSQGVFLFDFLLQVLNSKCISLIASSACRKCEKDNFVHFLGHNSNLCKAFYVHHKNLISWLLHNGFLIRWSTFLWPCDLI